ncbi:MAG: hypothetical protein KBB88_00305 [Candidatus Pacebacteria bacterium]|nr:hypothetical protein [Candidatus Paceibacterota bacterium]
MKNNIIVIAGFGLVVLALYFFVLPNMFSTSYTSGEQENTVKGLSRFAQNKEESIDTPAYPKLDTVAYDKKIEEIANNPKPEIVYETITTQNEQGEPVSTRVPMDPQPAPQPTLWPVKTVYPNDGALLPFNRIVAYYGNLYSTKMGVLGEYPEDEMLAKLEIEVKKWEDADPTTPVVPALHYIAVVAQGSAGKDGKYKSRMPFTEIDKVLAMAEKIHALVFLDIQVGFSNVETEVPLLETYLKLPNVHLGLDPEFSMKNGIVPGKVVGTYDAVDINFTANYLAKLVQDNDLPPKILVVHRYTQKMVTNYQNIKPLPEVQIVMDMDGWGGMAKKTGTYNSVIYREPVQFTGFKLFYKNDILDTTSHMMTPAEVLKLRPQPLYIQYQ